jgi:ketosteroid isomerase-like protein
MPRANAPEETGRLLGEAMTSGDVDAALSLYEPDATFAIPKGFGEGSVTGHDALREVLTGFLAMGPDLRITPEKTLLSGGTALVVGRWTVTGRDADGNAIEAAGRYADIVRRQPDGNWLFVIDNPNGSD